MYVFVVGYDEVSHIKMRSLWPWPWPQGKIIDLYDICIIVKVKKVIFDAVSGDKWKGDICFNTLKQQFL